MERRESSRTKTKTCVYNPIPNCRLHRGPTAERSSLVDHLQNENSAGLSDRQTAILFYALRDMKVPVTSWAVGKCLIVSVCCILTPVFDCREPFWCTTASKSTWGIHKKCKIGYKVGLCLSGCVHVCGCVNTVWVTRFDSVRPRLCLCCARA